MKYLIFILFPFICFSQQTVEICNDFKTFSYFTYSTENGTIEWEVNGLYYYGNEITLTWDKAGIYEITATAISNDCPSLPQTYNVTVIECDPLTYWIPNCFTPDENEFNQLWGPVFTSGYSTDHFKLFVFNRWGEIVWESNDPAGKWDGTYDGKKCTEGIYTWVVKFDLLNTDEKRIDHGHVTLLR
jgi:gliding motility-associated-like protein